MKYYNNNLLLLTICIFSSYCLSIVSGGQQFNWVKTDNKYNYFDTTNWNPFGIPTSDDGIQISQNNSYVVINNTSSVTSVTFDTLKNGTMVFVQNAALSAQVADIKYNSTLFVDTPSTTVPAFSVSLQANLASNLYFKSGVLNLANLGVTNGNIQFGTGSQKLLSNFATLLNTQITQNSGANSVFSSAARIVSSSITSQNALFNSDNAGVTSTTHSSNYTFTSSTFKTNNYFLMEQVKVNIKKSNLYFKNINLVLDSSFYADNSLVSFDNYFTTISTNPVILKNFCILQSTNSSAKMVASYNSIIYFQNTIFDMKGSFVLRDNAQLIFADLILPIRPLSIKLYGNAKIKYQSSWFGGVSYMMNSVQDLETPSTTTPTSTPTATSSPNESNITVPTTVSTLSFELNDNSQLEVADNVLQNINILNNGEGTIIFNNNVTLSNVSISGSVVSSGSLELNQTIINGNVVNSGNIYGSGTVNGGVVNTGNIGATDSVNTIVILGSFSSSTASTIGILINSPSSYSQINVSGSFNFQGTVHIRINQAAVLPNQVYKIINYPNQVSYSFNNVTVTFSDATPTTAPFTYTLIINPDNSLSLKVIENKKSSESVPSNIIIISSAFAGILVITLLVAAVVISYKKKQASILLKEDIVSSIELPEVSLHLSN